MRGGGELTPLPADLKHLQTLLVKGLIDQSPFPVAHNLFVKEPLGKGLEGGEVCSEDENGSQRRAHCCRGYRSRNTFATYLKIGTL